MMTSVLAASLLAPFFVEMTPEVRSTYQSLGKIVEDRPMQITSIRAGYATERFGRFGIRNWDVSSLTDRRADAHRHALYHMEFGPIWQYGFDIVKDWRLISELTRSWTMYRGFDDRAADRTYHWWQIDQELRNPYLVPYYRLRKCFRGNDYVYFKAGVRRRFPFLEDFYLTPGVFVEGGSSRNYRRVIGARPDGRPWRSGVSSVTFRLELGWTINENFGVFSFVEQYMVVGQGARHANAASTYLCAHNDWTYGGIGLRMSF